MFMIDTQCHRLGQGPSVKCAREFKGTIDLGVVWSCGPVLFKRQGSDQRFKVTEAELTTDPLTVTVYIILLFLFPAHS